jgi:hypothetical protein
MNLFKMAAAATGIVLSISQAQAQSITGTITDGSRRPVSFAIAALHHLPDSVLVTTAQPDSTGAFSFIKPANGKYYTVVKASGFKPWQSAAFTIDEAHTQHNLKTIALEVTAGQLKEVQVTSRKDLVEHKADRTVVNVDAMLTATGGTALDVLSKSPGVQVDQNGLISLKGKQGVTVYINDKPTYLSGEELANYLRSMPSSTLDKVELMPNPPSRYDAAGTGGIINIRLKKNGIKGFNGGLNLGGNQGQLTRLNNSLNLNYRNNKISSWVNASFNINNNFTDLDLNRVYLNPDNTPASYFEQKTYFNRRGNSPSVNAGADYFINDRHTIGMVVTGMYSDAYMVNDNTSNLLNAQRLKDSVIVARNEDYQVSHNGSINLNYRSRLSDKGHELTADADYLAYRYQTNQSFHNTGYHPDMSYAAQDLLKGSLPSQIDIYSIKTDYSQPLPLEWKLSAGLKYSSSRIENIANYNNTADGNTQPDYEKSNHFIYKEGIGAGYLNLNREWKKLSVQAGLRMEHTQMDGNQLGNPIKPDSVFRRNYTSLFPTLYMSYKLDTQSRNVINLNYGRRIQRPNYESLNPFISPMDKFTYYVGNPFLNPSFIQRVELSHTYRNKITTSLSYSHTKDDINETIEIKDGIYYSRPGNIGTSDMVSLSMDATIDITKKASVHAYSEVTYMASKGAFYGGYLNTSGTFWYISAQPRYSPGKGWDIEGDVMYRTKIVTTQFTIGSLWTASLAVRKKINDAFSVKVSFNDIFYTQIIKGEIGNLNLATASWVNRQDSRNFGFSLSYRFGKAFQTGNKHQNNSLDQERSRIGK